MKSAAVDGRVAELRAQGQLTAIDGAGDSRLESRAGVLGHGLFVGLTTDLVVAGAQGVEHRTRPG